jgi:tRNA (guanine37-N1)-methyltransferase
MRIDIITLFPEVFPSYLSASIMGRAQKLKKLDVRVHQLRDFAHNKWRKVDDKPFGGGAGMVMACQPLFTAVQQIKGRSKKKIPVIYFSPRGEKLVQKTAERFATEHDRLILVCGHYEGIDQRFIDACVNLELSIGDYVLTGGELPALVLIDAVARLLPGVVGKAASIHEESFSDALAGKKEYPHYTQPAEYKGLRVPPVLLTGDHGKIKAWRHSKTRK